MEEHGGIEETVVRGFEKGEGGMYWYVEMVTVMKGLG